MKKFKYTIFKHHTSPNLSLRMLGKVINTGIPDSAEGRRLVASLAENKYREYLACKGIIETKINLPKINEIANEYLKQHTQKRTKSGILYALENIDFKENYEINKTNIDAKIRKMKKREISKESKNTIIRKIQTFLNKCYDDGIITEKIELKKHRMKTIKKEPVPYTQVECEQIFSIAKQKDYEFYLLLAFLRYTGFRISETLSLKKSDLDFSSGFITVPNKVFKDVKQRFPIDDVVLSIYNEINRIRKTEYLDNRLFRWSNESRSRLSKWLREIENYLGTRIEGRGFHGFRRSFAESMFENGLGFDVIKDLMRHSSINLTMESYKSWQKSKLSNELQKLNSGVKI